MKHNDNILGAPYIASLDLSPIIDSEKTERLLSPSSVNNAAVHCRYGSNRQASMSRHMRHDIFLLSGTLELPNIAPLAPGDFISFSSDDTMPLKAWNASFLRYSHPSPGAYYVHCTRSNMVKPYPAKTPGLSVSMLYNDGAGHAVSLVDWDDTAKVGNHHHFKGEEILILSGELEDQYGRHGQGTWMRFYPGTLHAPRAIQATRILLRNSFL